MPNDTVSAAATGLPVDVTPARQPIAPAVLTRAENALVLIGWTALVASVVFALAP